MEKKTDNAIVRDDTVENIVFGAEINNEIMAAYDASIEGVAASDASDFGDLSAAHHEDDVTVFADADSEGKEVVEDTNSDAKGEEIVEATNSDAKSEETCENANVNAELDVTASGAVTMTDAEGVAEKDEIADELSKSVAISAAEAMQRILNFTAKATAEADEDAKNDVEKSQNTDAVSNSNIDQVPFSTPTDDMEGNNASGSTEEITDDGNVSDAKVDTEDADNKDEANKDGSDTTPEITETEGDTENEESGETASSEVEYDEDGFIIEDEFSNIPDSFLEEDIFGDEASSISALLYDDDDANAESDFEEVGSVSFADLKMEMQKIKDNAKELHAVEETPEDVIEDSEDIDEPDNDAEELGDISEPIDEDAEATEDVGEDVISESEDESDAIPERKSYFRETEKDDEPIEDIEPEEEVTEHIITIDRSRIRERSVPEGRIIDIVFEAVELFTFTLLVVMMILSFAFKHSAVSGESMMPTFNDGDRLIISNLFYTPHRGDVIVFDDRTNDGYDDEPIIKRIIALEGDAVKIEGGTLYIKISGSEDFIVADYVNEMNTPLRDMNEIIVPEGEMFVMGDNVTGSKDSRDPAVGTVKVESILGKVILRFYAVEEVESDETGEYTTSGRIVFHTNFKTKSQGE